MDFSEKIEEAGAIFNAWTGRAVAIQEAVEVLRDNCSSTQLEALWEVTKKVIDEECQNLIDKLTKCFESTE